jgi:hypothetical protein
MTQEAKKTAKKKAVDPYKVSVAKRVYQAFTDAGNKRTRGNELTQEELGAKVAIALGQKVPTPQATVSRWMSEKNPAQPDPLTLRAIAKILGVDVNWLLYGAEGD